MNLKHLSLYFQKRDSLFLGFAFLAGGIMFGSWVTRIPDIKRNLELSESDLGFALIGAPIGAIMMMPFCGLLVSKIGIGRTNMIFSILHLISPILLVNAWNFWSLALGLVYFGLTEAVMNVSVNASVSGVEKKLGRPIMSSCHGMWSLGGMIGAGVSSIVIGSSFPAKDHLVAVSLFLILVIFLISGTLLSAKEEGPGTKAFALPDRSLLNLSLIAFCILAAEGALADWSTLYMADTLKSDPYIVGFAYANFALFMTIGRFLGDDIIPILGRRQTVIIGSFSSSIALGMALWIGSPIISILALGIVGLGYSCVVPVLFSAASNSKKLTSGAGIAAISTIGYFGFLGGPPSIGFIAEAHSLTLGLGVVVILSLISGLVSTRVKF